MKAVLYASIGAVYFVEVALGHGVMYGVMGTMYLLLASCEASKPANGDDSLGK